MKFDGILLAHSTPVDLMDENKQLSLFVHLESCLLVSKSERLDPIYCEEPTAEWALCYHLVSKFAVHQKVVHTLIESKLGALIRRGDWNNL